MIFRAATTVARTSAIAPWGTLCATRATALLPLQAVAVVVVVVVAAEEEVAHVLRVGHNPTEEPFLVKVVAVAVAVVVVAVVVKACVAVFMLMLLILFF